MAKLSAEERRRVAAAIGAAERSTSGELIVVLTEASDDYAYIPVLWAALAALLAGAVASTIEFAAIDGHVAAIETGALVVGFLATRWWPLRVRLVPPPVRRARAGALARVQFVERNLHLTRDHTGVLIFVSLAERYVEVIADKGINDRVAPGQWDGVVDAFLAEVKAGRLAAGLVRIVGDCGGILALHCPPSPDDTNELPDGLVEL